MLPSKYKYSTKTIAQPQPHPMASDEAARKDQRPVISAAEAEQLCTRLWGLSSVSTKELNAYDDRNFYMKVKPATTTAAPAQAPAPADAAAPSTGASGAGGGAGAGESPSTSSGVTTATTGKVDTPLVSTS